ncbi:hypothetical protein B0H13DRAFT_2417782 [Mycena leptocephala]|nr:hypothetical protein B0H13DRAFT_2417782 [Mycena leptocephala]
MTTNKAWLVLTQPKIDYKEYKAAKKAGTWRRNSACAADATNTGEKLFEELILLEKQTGACGFLVAMSMTVSTPKSLAPHTSGAEVTDGLCESNARSKRGLFDERKSNSKDGVELHIKLSQMGERYETDSIGWPVGQNPDAKGEPSQYRTAPENSSKLPHRQILPRCSILGHKSRYCREQRDVFPSELMNGAKIRGGPPNGRSDISPCHATVNERRWRKLTVLLPSKRDVNH